VLLRRAGISQRLWLRIVRSELHCTSRVGCSSRLTVSDPGTRLTQWHRRRTCADSLDLEHDASRLAKPRADCRQARKRPQAGSSGRQFAPPEIMLGLLIVASPSEAASRAPMFRRHWLFVSASRDAVVNGKLSLVAALVADDLTHMTIRVTNGWPISDYPLRRPGASRDFLTVVCGDQCG